MRYVILNTAKTLVYSANEYTGTDFDTFKTQYEADNAGKIVVDIGNSTFPAGQGWSAETEGVIPQDGSPKGLSDLLPAVIRAVRLRTDSLEYDGYLTFKGQQFPRDHDTRDDVVLLAVAVASNAAMATAMLPLRTNGISGVEATIDTVAEANTFALGMLSPLKAVYAAQADELAVLLAMTNVEQLCKYVDPR